MKDRGVVKDVPPEKVIKQTIQKIAIRFKGTIDGNYNLKFFIWRRTN